MTPKPRKLSELSYTRLRIIAAILKAKKKEG